jgi:hypothetical protein
VFNFVKHRDLLFRSAGALGQLDQILRRSMIQVPLAGKLGGRKTRLD